MVLTALVPFKSSVPPPQVEGFMTPPAMPKPAAPATLFQLAMVAALEKSSFTWPRGSGAL